MFNLVNFLDSWFSAIPDYENPKIQEAIKKAKEQFPDDVNKQIDALTNQLKAILEPYKDVDYSSATIKGIATDILHGTGGSDPDAWTGSV